VLEEAEREELAGDEMDDSRSQTDRKFVVGDRDGTDPEHDDGDDAASERSSVLSSVSLRQLDENVRGMIFVRTLDLSKALLAWMINHPVLSQLSPGRITGVNAGVKNGGRSLLFLSL
jgi:hypothetical protein